LDAALVRAFAAALRNPASLGYSQDGDLRELAASFKGTPEQFEAALDADPGDPAFCQAAILIVQAAIDSDKAAARRVRALMAYKIATSN
jgi:hypothetical protein